METADAAPGTEKEAGQDGNSRHSPAQAPLSSASSLPKEKSQVELELRVLEALEMYPPFKLQGINRHFVLFGLMEYLQKSLDRQFSAEEVLQLLDRFFNLEMLQSEDEESQFLGQDEGFSLPKSFFVKEQ